MKRHSGAWFCRRQPITELAGPVPLNLVYGMGLYVVTGHHTPSLLNTIPSPSQQPHHPAHQHANRGVNAQPHLSHTHGREDRVGGGGISRSSFSVRREAATHSLDSLSNALARFLRFTGIVLGAPSNNTDSSQK